MRPIPPAVNHWFTAHHGVASTADLHRLGLSPWDLRNLCKNNVLEATGKGVYRLAGMSPSPEATAVALSTMHPATFVSSLTAARFRGARPRSADMRIRLVAPHGLHLVVPPGVIVQQCRDVRADDAELLADGRRVATGARLAFDAARALPESALFALVEDLLYRRITTADQLVAMARRLCRRGRPGSTRFASVLVNRLPGGPMESGAEIAVGRALVAHGIPVVAQHRVTIAGRELRFDFAVPHLRWAIEVDQDPRHLWSGGVAADARRDDASGEVGWNVDRITRLDMLALPARIAELRATFDYLNRSATA